MSTSSPSFPVDRSRACGSDAVRHAPRATDTARASLAARLSPLLIAALLAACAHAPDAPPALPTMNERFANHALLAQHRGDTGSPVLSDWWLGFEDPVLTGIVRRAIDQNLDLAAAIARVEQSRAIAQAAGAQRLPQVAAQGQVVRERQSLRGPEGKLASAFPGYQRDLTLQTLGVGASWEADLAGGLRSGEAAAVAEWQAAEASRMGAQVSVAAEAADAYFRARAAQARIGVAESHLRTQARLLDLIQARFQGGLATQREVAEAQALLLQARGTLPPLRAELARQLHRLDVLMGEQAGTFAPGLLMSAATAAASGASTVAAPPVAMASPPAAREAPFTYRVPTLPADIGPAELMRRRPDVIAAERLLDAAQARIGVATAEYYPHLTLGGVLGSESLSGRLLSSAAFQPQALLGLHWRLFDFGRVDAEVAQARGARAEALAQVKQRMLRASEDVENAVVTLTQLEAQRGDLEDEVRAHQAARDAAEDAYKGGAASLIEVLQEDRLLLASRDQLAQLQADHARAAVATFRALGGGWTPAGAGAGTVGVR